MGEISGGNKFNYDSHWKKDGKILEGSKVNKGIRRNQLFSNKF